MRFLSLALVWLLFSQHVAAGKKGKKADKSGEEEKKNEDPPEQTPAQVPTMTSVPRTTLHGAGGDPHISQMGTAQPQRGPPSKGRPAFRLIGGVQVPDGHRSTDRQTYCNRAGTEFAIYDVQDLAIITPQSNVFSFSRTHLEQWYDAEMAACGGLGPRSQKIRQDLSFLISNWGRNTLSQWSQRRAEELDNLIRNWRPGQAPGQDIGGAGGFQPGFLPNTQWSSGANAMSSSSSSSSSSSASSSSASSSSASSSSTTTSPAPVEDSDETDSEESGSGAAGKSMGLLAGLSLAGASKRRSKSKKEKKKKSSKQKKRKTAALLKMLEAASSSESGEDDDDEADDDDKRHGGDMPKLVC